jgi:hypothetical protein
MDPNTQELVMGAAGASGGAPVYVEDVFSTYLYTGNGSTQTITNGIDLSGKGGLVWIKNRVDAYDHRLFDTTRGATKLLESSTTSAETTESTSLTSFTASGFSLDSALKSNRNGSNHVSWTFRKAAKFFDVVTFTTSNTNTNKRIAHSLGSVPGAIIVKGTNAAGNWIVYHRSLGTSNFLYLNTTNASLSSANLWTASGPSSTDFGIDETQFGTGTWVAYLFAHDAGGFGDSGNNNVISCGSYTGGSGTTFINLGWEAQFILKKNATSAENWVIVDVQRGAPVGGSTTNSLFANLSSAETAGSTTGYLYPTSTGFADANANSGQTYIYIAIRRGPMKTPTDATKVFSVTATSHVSVMPYSELNDSNSNTASDACFVQSRDSGGYGEVFDRLRGIVEASSGGSLVSRNTKALKTTSTAAETNTSYGFIFRYENSYFATTGIGYSVMWSFRRAPGFFDVVAYTGTGSARTVSHNLGVAPELIIVKSRSRAGEFWPVYHNGLGAMDVSYLFLNQDFAKAVYGSSTSYFSSTAPTNSVFGLGTDASVNFNTATYIAYLFATCPGVSKVGYYTGTGATLNVDCGFTNGARFVLIKRTDNAGDWYVWDTARGIISANDPYLLLNSTAAEVTNTDYIDPLSSGFQISSTAPAAINTNGGSFIFLAIA